jgi:hypothetical protein
LDHFADGAATPTAADQREGLDAEKDDPGSETSMRITDKSVPDEGQEETAAVSTPSNCDHPLSDDDEVFQFDGDKDSGDSDKDSGNSAEGLHGEPDWEKKSSTKRKTRWTPTENAEIHKYFAKHLSDKKAPNRADCLKAKQASLKASGELYKRPWHLIVKKVSAMNHKKQGKQK